MDDFTVKMYNKISLIATAYNNFINSYIDTLMDQIPDIESLPKRVKIPFISTMVYGNYIRHSDAASGLKHIIKECKGLSENITTLLSNDGLSNANKTVKRANQVTTRKALNQVQKDTILAKQNYHCVDCGVAFNERIHPHFDHKIPVFSGGLSITDNMQALCPTCHDYKSRTERTRLKDKKNTIGND